MTTPSDHPGAGKVGSVRLLAIGHCCPGLPEPGRSAEPLAIDRSPHRV